MKSKSRNIAVFALLAAVAMFTVGVMLPKVVSKDKPIPLDLTASTMTLTDPAATVGAVYQFGAEHPQPIEAPVNRQFNMSLNQPATETTASARVGFTTARADVDDDLESLLNAEVWTFTVDRLTGDAEGTAKVSDTPATPPVEVPIDGLWAKFPQYTEQRSYDYFDATLRRTVPAEFQGTINRTNSQGRDVELYVFRQEIEPTNVAELYPGVRNRAMVDKNGEQVEGFLHHGGWRELQVEPRTGLIISVEEDVQDVYVSAEGEELEELLSFHGKTHQNTQDAMMRQAMDTSGQRETTKVGVTLMVVGVIVAAVSLLVALWPRRRRAELDK
ncbi:MAG TPA: DUF3068 domain-containing protein [Candidatus Corynebacterium gallistercoris]|uniref:DUF3068 domain-containing protein n=1 Tax=Candidatus Corynebacterium gallistercoris TaxID=2838530 RepID=A0A9D1RZ24_9CORY|nr:DUF3068 domain-containing protein [Candidatus Corynebacterium gallistercoris]